MRDFATENVMIKPLSLQFESADLEKEYTIESKLKFRTLFRKILVFTLLIILSTTWSPASRSFWIIVALKLVAAFLNVLLLVFFDRIYRTDTILFPMVTFCAFSMICSRLIVKDDDGMVLIRARELDMGFLYLVLAGIAFFMGLRFKHSVAASIMVVLIYVVVIWAGAKDMHDVDDKLSEQARLTFWSLLGFSLFNIILFRKLEINSRKDYVLTRRLKSESIVINLEMEGFKWFSHAMDKSGPAGVAPALIAQLQIRNEEVALVELIGAGSFCDVHKAKYKATDVAAKKLRAVMAPEVMQEFGAESAIMSQFRHPNICMLMGICYYPPMLVLELCQRGSLYKVLHVQQINLDWSLLLNILMEAAAGMAYLHSQDPPILHRDLKSLNLLLTSQWQYKVADFGISALREKGLE